MEKKKEYVLFTTVFIAFIVLSQIVFVSAITGSMGNARMILYPEVNGLTNTVIEKSILVKNVNDVPITVKLEVDQDSTDFLELVDNEVSLEPGEDYRAAFKIKVKKPGKYDGKINVFFSETSGDGPGVALTSNIIIIASNPKDSTEEIPEEDTKIDNEEPATGDILPESGKERNPMGILLTITTAILIVALVALFILGGKKRKKSVPTPLNKLKRKKKVEKKKVGSKPKKSKKINEKKK